MSLADELMNDLMSSDEEDDKGDLQAIPEDDEDASDAMAVDDEDGEDNKEEIKRRLSNSPDDDLSKIIVKEIGDLKKLARLISSETMDSVLKRIDEYGN